MVPPFFSKAHRPQLTSEHSCAVTGAPERTYCTVQPAGSGPALKVGSPDSIGGGELEAVRCRARTVDAGSLERIGSLLLPFVASAYCACPPKAGLACKGNCRPAPPPSQANAGYNPPNLTPPPSPRSPNPVSPPGLPSRSRAPGTNPGSPPERTGKAPAGGGAPQTTPPYPGRPGSRRPPR